MKYPTVDGIAVSPWELDLPETHTKERNNHHAHFTRRAFGRFAITQALRDLERHQYLMHVDQHNWLHDRYEPPELPTDGQAAREVIDAYENGEMFKIWNKRCHWYDLKAIPPDLVDGLVAKYSLVKVFDMAAD